MLESGLTVPRFFSTNHNSLLCIASNEIASFCIDHRSRQMAFFFVQRRGKGRLSRYFEIFWNKKGFSLLYKTNRFHHCRASDSVIDHKRRQNVVRTSVTHSATPRVPLFCSYHILTSSVTSFNDTTLTKVSYGKYTTRVPDEVAYGIYEWFSSQ